MTTQMKPAWCLITPEYPPSLGGVADYTRLMAIHLAAAGEQVTVLAPSGPESADDAGVRVAKVLGGFGPMGWWSGGRVLATLPRSRRLFLQWVPHGYGFKSLNLFLPLWLIWRVMIRRDQLWIMVHEPFLSFANSVRQRLAACIHRGMVWTLLRLATRAFAGNRTWIAALEPWRPRRLTVEWLPVPSNVPVVKNPEATALIRHQAAGPDGLVGHFGTYGAHTRGVLEEPLRLLLEREPGVNALLLGKNGDLFRAEFLQANPHLANRITAPGTMPLEQISIHLAAIDVMLQAYTGGISTRNGSIMAILSHGKAAVGTFGHVTDPDWSIWGVMDLLPITKSVEMAECTARLIRDIYFRADRERKSRNLYAAFFSLESTIPKLLSTQNNLISDGTDDPRRPLNF